MVHPTDTSITDSTMMRMGWFEGLALTAHAQFAATTIVRSQQPLFFGWDGRGWYRSWICQSCFDMTRQGQTGQEGIHHGQKGRNPTCLGQKGNGQC